MVGADLLCLTPFPIHLWVSTSFPLGEGVEVPTVLVCPDPVLALKVLCMGNPTVLVKQEELVTLKGCDVER